MQVGRKTIGGSAVMVLRIDKLAPKEVLLDLVKLPEVISIQEISL
jgi:D-3-phosphoglycerate dehydrogenase